jgi:membrane-associated phospholipid phosphatase
MAVEPGVATNPSTGPPARPRVGWSAVARSLARPYRVTVPMAVLVSLVPVYLFLPELAGAGARGAPALAVDGMIPLVPAWALVYGALYAWLIVLPVLVVHDEGQVRRAARAYLSVWVTAYVCFVAYPTAAPRPDEVAGEGFAAWGLRTLYASDPPYNCFPSLHVAHSFVSALVCARVSRGVGVAAAAGASLVGASTLFTRQHYVLDVVAGALLAWVACAVFLRGSRREGLPELERRLAPVLAAALLGAVALGVAGFWVVYRLGLRPA